MELTLIGVALVLAAGGLVWYFSRDARAVERELGEAHGAITTLIAERDSIAAERDSLRLALEHALRARPTDADYERVSREQAGGVAAPIAPDDLKLR